MLVRSRTNGLSEVIQHRLHRRGVDHREQIPHCLASVGMDEAVDVQPIEAVVDARYPAFAARRPDPPDDWFESDPVFVEGPYLYAGRKIPSRFNRVRKAFFLKSVCALGSACS